MPLLPLDSFFGMAPLWWLGWSLALRHAGEYVHAMKALAPLAPNYCFIKNHVSFASFPPFGFIFPLP
jgi:hypothetical protein